MKKRLLWALLSWLSLLSFGARAQTNVPLAQETFEADGEGVRYTSNTFGSGSTTIYFERRMFTTPTGSSTSYSGSSGPVSNQQGSYAWMGERVRGTAYTGTNANVRPPGYVQLTVPTTNYKNLRLVVAFADPHVLGNAGSNVGTADRVRLRYSFDGSPFVTAGLLVNSNGTASTGSWGIDTSTPLDSVSDSVLGQAYRDVTAPISGTGSSLRVQIVVDANPPEITFDNIRVFGDVDAGAKPTLANLETSTLTYTEGQASPVQLTNTLTVGYSDNSATNITGGTVSISSGFTSGDQLSPVNQNGIVSSYSTGTGVLTLSGTASQAAYQAALRAITFSNSNTTTLPSGTRQITFQLNNGSAQSNTPVRNLNVTATLNAPATLPYTENFNSDAEGTRYFGNSFVRQSTTAGFFRATNSPASFGGTQIGSLTYTGWSGGYWYGEGTKTIGTTGTAVQLAPVNAAGAVGLKFVLALGSSSTSGSGFGWDAADYFKLYYRTGGSGGSWTEFGSFTVNTTLGDGVLRRGGNADSVGVGTALRYFTFPLPAQAAASNLDFQLVQVSDVDEELAFDNIRISAAVVPTVTTTTPSSITTSSATLGGNVTSNGDGTLTERGVVYVVGTGTPTTSNTKALVSTSGVTTGAYSGTVSGLSPGTTYTVRAYAINEAGTGYGASSTFTTAAVAPTVTTAAATSITSSSAVLGGNVTTDGGATVTTRGVVYSVTSTNGTPTIGGMGVTQAANGTGAGSFSATISGLAPGTSYSVQAYATNPNGTVYGGVQTFTTAANAPTVTTATPSNITSGSAVLGGNVTADGGATVTARGVAYSVTSTNGTPAIGGTGVTNAANGTGTGSFSATISGLASGTNYSVRAYATNSTGTTYGGVQTFTTITVASATAQSVTVNLDANGNGTLLASSVNNGSTGSGTLTYTIQKIVYGKVIEGNTLTLTTPSGANFTQVRFASYGTPFDNGNGNYLVNSNCNAANSVTTAQNSFLNRSTGSMDAFNTGAPNNNPQLGDPCSGIGKSLALQVAYSTDAASQTYACVDAGKTEYVLLTVTDGNGSTSTAVASVTVNAPPAISITNVNPSTAQRGATVTVTGTNLGGITSLTVNGTPATISNLANTSSNVYTFTFVVPNNTAIGAGNLVVTAPCSQTLSPAFTVAAPALTATVSTTAGSPTTTSPIPFSVSFSQSVGTTFTASDVTVANGTVTSGSFVGSGSGPYTFSVTPTAVGTVTVSLAAGVATDANNTGNTASNAVSVQYQAPTIVVGPAALPNGTQGTAYSQTITASGGTSPYTYAITMGSLPAGLTLSAAGTLSGTPTTSGTYNFRVTATDNSAAPGPYIGSRAYSLTIGSPTITVAPTTLPNGTVGAAYSQTLMASGGTSPYTYAVTAGSLPAGLTLASSGTLSGTPTAGGSFSFTVTATDAGGFTGSQAYTFNVASPTIAVAPASLPNGTVGAAYNQTFTASGGTPPYSFAIVSGTLPAGLTLASNGVLAGTPTAGGSFTFTVRALDSSTGSGPYSGLRTYTLTINAPAITVAPTTLPNGAAGTAYSQTLSASGGTAPYSFAITAGALPAGLTLSAAGVLSGTPTASGTFNFTVTATDASTGNGPYSGARAYTVTIAAPAIAVAPATLPNGTVGAAYSQTITASGGTSPYTYTITAGALPAGLTLASSGSLSGTPTAGGSFSFTVTATDAGGFTGSQAYTITIAAPANIRWTGAVSTDWFTAGNWSPAVVPGAGSDVTIATVSSGNYPLIASGTATSRALTLNSGGSLTMSGGTLDAQGMWTNNGTFTATGGTVQLGVQTGSIVGSSTTTFWNLTTSGNAVNLQTSAGLAVRRLLTTNTQLVTNNNLLTLLSDANGTAMTVNPNSSIGVVGSSVTVQRYIGPATYAGAGYRHLSSPTVSLSGSQGTQFSDLATASFTPQVNPAYNASATPGATQPYPNIFGYDQSRLATVSNNLSAFDKGYYSPSSLSDRMSSGFGYTVNLAANQTVTFKGGLSYGDLTRNLSRNAAGTPNEASAGWQLLGNPYPSPYDYAQQAASDRPNLDAAIYVFTATGQYAGQYRTILNGIGDAVLPMGQAFFARVSQGQTSGSIIYRNANRVTTYQNPTYQRPADARPLAQLTLHAAGSALADEASVYFEAGATAGFEPQFDAVKLPNPTGLNLTTSALGGQQLAIDGQPELGSAQRVVPLTLGVPAVGSYVLTASQLLNLSAVPVYLRDLLSGAVIDLHQQPSYSFTVGSAAALVQGRFELVFAPQQALATVPAALAQQVALYPNPAHASTSLELPARLGTKVVTATLVDALGRQVRTVQLPAQGAVTHQLDLHELPTGVYALRLTTELGVIVRKLVVE